MNQRIKLFIILSILFIGLAGCRNQELPESTAVPRVTAEIITEPTATPTTSPTATPLYTSVFERADCQFPSTGTAKVECGYLIVPEDRANPDRMIRIHVAIISSISDNPAPDPVIYLDGGPGGFTLTLTPSYIQLYQPILRERDLILFDQRGVGYSEPSLDCPEVEAAFLAHIEEWLDSDELQLIGLEAFSRCRERLVAEGINLSAYNSAASAADLDDLRQVLGYESWNLFGVSYGTRLALTAVRDFGSTGTIRSVILDSVYPPQIDGNDVLGHNAARAFDLLFARCAAIEQCNSDYPDLRNRFYQLVDKLNVEPLTVVVIDRANRITYRIPIDGDDLIYLFFDMMYNSSQILNLPKMISQIEGGVSTILANHITNTFNRQAYTSEGMTMSVQCYEEIPFDVVDEADTLTTPLPTQIENLFESDAEYYREQCELWQVETADPVEAAPISSDLPTLLLAGDYDPITPPMFAKETAEYLTNAFYFEFEGIGHGVAYSTGCGFDIIVDFLNQPDIQPDDSCLDRLFIGFVPK